MSYIVDENNIPEIDGAISISKDYNFTPSTGLIVVNDYDFEEVVFIMNTGTNEILYRIGSQSKTASIFNREVVVDYDTSGMSINDNLLIFYKNRIEDDTSVLLNKLIELQKQTNKLLNKIYN